VQKGTDIKLNNNCKQNHCHAVYLLTSHRLPDRIDEEKPPGELARTTDLTSALQTAPYGIPTAISWAPGRVHVLGRARNNSLWVRTSANDVWDPGFEFLRNNLNNRTNLAAVSRGVEDLNVFFVGNSTGAYQKAWEVFGTRWKPDGTLAWVLGGNLSSTIEIASWAVNRIDMFALDLSQKRIHQVWNEAGWSDWRPVNGDGGPSAYLYPPTAVLWGPNSGYVFVVDEKTLEVHISAWETNKNNDTVYAAAFQSIGGRCTSRPSALSSRGLRIDLVCRGADARVIGTNFNGKQWARWRVCGDSPEIVAEPHIFSYIQDQMNVVAIANDSTLRLGVLKKPWKLGWHWNPVALETKSKGAPRAVSFGTTTNPKVGIVAYSPNDTLLYVTYNDTSSGSTVDGLQSTVLDLGLPTI
jgi:hypothetical protein